MIIYPTKTCFDDAAKLFTKYHLEGSRDILIVHGIAEGIVEDGKYKKYAHAWVEKNGHCYELGRLDNGDIVEVEYNISEFYSERNIIDYTKYTLEDAVKASREHHIGLSGPWLEKYRKLCGDYER